MPIRSLLKFDELRSVASWRYLQYLFRNFENKSIKLSEKSTLRFKSLTIKEREKKIARHKIFQDKGPPLILFSSNKKNSIVAPLNV